MGMSVETNFGNLFKPEIKSSGRKLIAGEKVSLSSKSDTFIQAYIRVSPPFKVSFTSEAVGSKSFDAICNCPVAKKSRFCKHVWATLLCVEEECPDFLEAKTEIEKPEVSDAIETGAKVTYQEASKLRASQFRKEQYQKHKLHAKNKKREKESFESSVAQRNYSEAVEVSMDYFSKNGFPMPSGPARDILTEAKRKLSRVFHPDKGGSHEETVELNHHCEVILEFLGD
jgi:uncharacterized Zn finger protein